jgi:hypothetical protein
LNITVTDTAGDGYVTVNQCDAPRPNASSLNFVTGQTIPNAVITKLAADGTVCIYVSAPTELIADVGGYFPANSAYVPLVPARLLESRIGLSTVDGLFNGIGTPAPGSVTQVQVAGRGGVPTGAGAAMLNVTVTGGAGSGFVTVYPCDAPLPRASNLNYTAGQTIPNAVFAKLAANGTVCLYTSNRTDVLVDVVGYIGAV